MDSFKLYCKYINKLITERKIVPQIINRNYMKLRFDKLFIEKFMTENNIEKDIFDYMLNKEIPDYIISILGDNIDFLTRYTISNNEAEEEENNNEDIENKIREKLKIVEKIFINTELISTYKLKANSKNPLLKYVDWEVNEKYYDKEDGQLDRKKYSIIELKTTSSSSGIPLISLPMPFNVNDENDKKILFSLTTEDIDYLIMELNLIRQVINNE